MVLATSGIGAGLAIGLVGCDDADKSKQTPGRSESRDSLLHRPVDTSSQAKNGETLVMVSSGEPNTLDPVTGVTNAFATDAFAHLYSRLLKAKVGKYPDSPDGALEG